MSSEIAIIGGTGFDQIDELAVTDRKVVRTPFGDPSGILVTGKMARRTFMFLPRHGAEHTIPPHKVNYRANIWALHQCGVKKIIGFAAVGGIDSTLLPGTIVIPTQLIDYTWGRAHTFHDGNTNSVCHIDFTRPYAEKLRKQLLKAAARASVEVRDQGCYAATQGPRRESAAEIDRLERDGATVVGMTGMPEAALARELDIEYACMAIVVNPAAGRGPGEITMEDIGKCLRIGSKKALDILRRL